MRELTPKEIRNMRKMLDSIDKIADEMGKLEEAICNHCSNFQCHECPMGVVLTDYPRVLCAQRVVEQMHIQSHERFDKVVKE